eukprot:CAMPEP_0202970120 /NCGR_PEP_ID=MMETSP1396-20130829/16107_1 /ASSEMBLY_ACC=CAM_ASM_000872 /TAXON_ID= /ORGANISM="Pseudokeronopsis sp., Strain Brazil" /LENGTH=43 /DNA_ID= /DNA_START= /DNA_END= /DNA_ORIENTATION=
MHATTGIKDTSLVPDDLKRYLDPEGGYVDPMLGGQAERAAVVS